jgi:hypothetical protein
VIENSCEKVLQNEAVVTVSGKQGEELLKEPIDTSSIDIEMSKSLSSQEIERSSILRMKRKFIMYPLFFLKIFQWN